MHLQKRHGILVVVLAVLALAAARIFLGFFSTSTEARAPRQEQDSVELAKTMTVTASAYNSTRAQTDSTPHTAAFGDHITPGMQVIAVSEDLEGLGFGQGTSVRIEGLPGVWKVADRMNSRFRRRIDIYMGTDHGAAKAFGERKVTIRRAGGG